MGRPRHGEMKTYLWYVEYTSRNSDKFTCSACNTFDEAMLEFVKARLTSNGEGFFKATGVTLRLVHDLR
jgi:hypothetical protein